MSHITAAFQWNIPYLSKVIGANYTAKYKDNNIIDVTVNDDSMLYTKKGINVHLYKQPLPRGAIRKVNGKMVASPELVFLQLANRLDLHRLILLGLQMCSHPVGKPSDAITNKKKLTNLLKNTVGHHGHKKAVQALKYIEDDSASIMESLLFMILSLPHTLGGYGLEGAYMNRKLSLNSKGKLQLEQSKCFVDIFFQYRMLPLNMTVTHITILHWHKVKTNFERQS